VCCLTESGHNNTFMHLLRTHSLKGASIRNLPMCVDRLLTTATLLWCVTSDNCAAKKM
jgi:hypothetical protein